MMLAPAGPAGRPLWEPLSSGKDEILPPARPSDRPSVTDRWGSKRLPRSAPEPERHRCLVLSPPSRTESHHNCLVRQDRPHPRSTTATSPLAWPCYRTLLQFNRTCSRTQGNFQPGAAIPSLQASPGRGDYRRENSSLATVAGAPKTPTFKNPSSPSPAALKYVSLS